MAGAYRYWLICLPDVDPSGLVLFTENDVDGGMLRDYSVPGRPRELRRVLLADVPGVFRAATRRIPVEPHRYADEWHWRNEIRKRLSSESKATASQSGVSTRQPLPGSKGSKYQIQRWVNERPKELSEAIWDTTVPPFALRSTVITGMFALFADSIAALIASESAGLMINTFTPF